MAATKFTETEREKLYAQLEAPFDLALIKWRVMRTFDNGRSGVILPFADPRAYTDRLNELFTPSGWTREYTISTVPSLCRMERGKAIVTSKVLVATAVTITRLGSHTGTGEEWADRENAVTAADAQAFKRACSCFGLGRYLYRFGETRVRLNSRGEPMAIPTLPEWALPPGMALAQANGLAGDTRGPVDQQLTAEIESFRGSWVRRSTGRFCAGPDTAPTRGASPTRSGKSRPSSGCRLQHVVSSGCATWPRWRAMRSSSP